MLLAAQRVRDREEGYEEEISRAECLAASGADLSILYGDDGARKPMEAVSLETPICSASRGFKLLHKMGWREGRGLGRQENGITEPVRLDTSYGLLGVGKATEYDKQSVDATKQRKRMEVEVQQAETDHERKMREEKVEREKETKAQVLESNREFYCKLCDKQYNNMGSMENHLASYDHHHKKRLIEMKESERERARQRGQGVDRDKESNKLMKEMEKRAAAEAAATPQGDNARGITTPSTLLPATDPTIIEQNKLGSQSKRTAISFGFGVIKPKRPNMAHGRGFGA